MWMYDNWYTWLSLVTEQQLTMYVRLVIAAEHAQIVSCSSVITDTRMRWVSVQSLMFHGLDCISMDHWERYGRCKSLPQTYVCGHYRDECMANELPSKATRSSVHKDKVTLTPQHIWHETALVTLRGIIKMSHWYCVDFANDSIMSGHFRWNVPTVCGTSDVFIGSAVSALASWKNQQTKKEAG